MAQERNIFKIVCTVYMPSTKDLSISVKYQLSELTLLGSSIK